MDKNPDKHLKYKKYYKNNTVYWGLGIENEVYLEFSKYQCIKRDVLLINNKRERYSHDYFDSYKSTQLLKEYLETKNEIVLPVMLNSHSFTKTDRFNNPKTLYTKLAQPNPKYADESLMETLIEQNSYFKDNETWMFDGDTIEFTTLDFFNTTLYDVIKELLIIRGTFVNNLNDSFKKLEIFKDYGSVDIMQKNHTFAKYMTNIYNVNMFNNGTLHYNLTLPTKINADGEIEDREKFINDHSRAIKIIQWMEPFLVAVYGSPDPLNPCIASQRCGVSRYVSLGTYNSDTMIPGKILTVPTDNKYHWYNHFDGYKKFTEIGLDINFNKHYNHGIEIRFLDHITDVKQLSESFECIVYLMDYILSSDRINMFGNPITNKIWNNLVLKTMTVGKHYTLTHEEKYLYEKIFKLKIKKNTMEDVYYEIYNSLKPSKFNFLKGNEFSKRVLKKKLQCFH